jgi:hypothetical protein
MKKMVPYLTTVLVVYFIVGFVKWQFNPALWNEGNRAFCIFVATMTCLLLGLVKTGLKDMQ